MTNSIKCKVLTALLLLCSLGFVANAQNQTVTKTFKDTPVEQVLHEIEAQTGLSFMYEAQSLDLKKKVSGSFDSVPVSKVLSDLMGPNVSVSFQGSIAILYSGKGKPVPGSSQVQVLPSAKKREIKGTVLDAKSGEPLMFVTVSIKGTTNGTVSDTNGRFSISAANGQTILFQILGFENVELLVDADTKNPVVKMQEETLALESVVVTALGITRNEKSVGYAVSKLDSEAINNTVSSNWMGGLDGKVAGLSMETASTGPGGSVRTTLRGENSLSHDKNEALFVIDGVPMISGMTASSSSLSYGDGADTPIDYGNGASDLNPDDIASVTVLKGPAATALYGSQAANGAIVITTKSGKDYESKVRVDVSSSTVFEQAAYWPDFQTEYGAGNGNASTRINQTYYSFWTIPADMSDTGEAIARKYSRLSFGPKFDGQMFYNYDSAHWVNNNGEWSIDSYNRTKWEQKDWYKGAFQTGYTTSNTVAISYNPDKNTSIRFSLNDKRNDWILPNLGYTSKNFSLSLNQKAGKKLTLAAKATYYKKDADNLPTTGYHSSAPMYCLLQNSSSTDIDWLKEEYFSGRLDYFTRLSHTIDTNYQTRIINYQADNIYKILYEHTNSLDRDRVFGNASVTYDFTPWLSLLVRSGIDLSTDFRTQRKAYYSLNYPQGYYKEQTVRQLLSTNDVLLTFKKDFGKDWDINATLGGSNQINNYSNVQLIATALDEPDVFILQNSIDALRHNTLRTNKQINSLFGTVSISWKGMAYLDITGRNDWSSTLPANNRSYFYPSVGLSVLLDKALNLPESVDLLKARASWANVGNDTDPYNLAFTYSNSSFPSSYIVPAKLQNPDLKPENVESWEFGLQGSFWKDRFNFDLAAYQTVTTNQIITVPTDFITGASSQYINAGNVTNKGLELSLGAMPICTKDFKWSLNFNCSRNINRLVELADGVDVWQMNTNTIGNRVYIYAYPGTELGRIYGQGYKRAPEGAYYLDENGKKVDCSGMKIIDKEHGFPVLSGTSTESLLDFGSIYPDLKGGFGTNLQYKNWKLGAQFSYQLGGKAFSITYFGLSLMGKLNNTVEGRYEGLMPEGVNDNGDGTYSKNTTIVDDIVTYYGTWVYSRNNVEENVFDTSYLKLKEIRLDYSLPRKLAKKTKVLTGASVGLFATNVFCLTNFPIYDPEVATLSGGSISRGIEACAYPMTRTYGVNLKLAF